MHLAVAQNTLDGLPVLAQSGWFIMDINNINNINNIFAAQRFNEYPILDGQQNTRDQVDLIGQMTMVVDSGQQRAT